MPSEVKEKTNTIAAADAMAGPRAGSVTVRNAVHRDAPRVLAAISSRGSMVDQRAPTIRTTTAIFRYACASTTMRKPEPRSEPSSDRNANATTTVGRTNGTVARARAHRRPGKWYRVSTLAMGNPTTSETAVLASACTVASPATRHASESDTYSIVPGERTCPASEASGTTMNASRKPAGAIHAHRNQVGAVIVCCA